MGEGEGVGGGQIKRKNRKKEQALSQSMEYAEQHMWQSQIEKEQYSTVSGLIQFMLH